LKSMSERVRILIAGAGPTGLGAAWRIDQYKEQDWLLCESEENAGGLAGSITDEQGFIWDYGGHVQFSHYDYFDRVMDELLGPEGWFYHQRKSWIWTSGRFVPYPFQANLHYLPEKERDVCLAGLAARSAAQLPPRHFDEWIENSFGAGIAAAFLRPYNQKVWGYPLEQMGWRWTGERVPTIQLDRVNGRIDDVTWGPNRQFRFPRCGGTGAIWRALANQLALRHPGRIRMRRKLVHVNTARNLAYLDDGEVINYELLLSTIPLDALVRFTDLTGVFESELAELKHSSTHVIGIALHGRPTTAVDGKSWIYFPEKHYPFYRVTVFSGYSPNNVPDSRYYWSLLTEVTESPYAIIDPATVVDQTIEGLRHAGVIEHRSSVHHVWHRRLEYGYPTPSLHRDQCLARILPALESRAVYSRGRFGAWKYEVSNQDHSFAQGVEVVNRWYNGAAETTLSHPEVVNRGQTRGRKVSSN
jgi:protoporphyrinogen oxidase